MKRLRKKIFSLWFVTEFFPELTFILLFEKMSTQHKFDNQYFSFEI